MQRYLGAFESQGLVARTTGQRVLYRPANHDAYVALLARLYVEWPDTLFRVIYALRDSKIRGRCSARSVSSS